MQLLDCFPNPFYVAMVQFLKHVLVVRLLMFTSCSEAATYSLEAFERLDNTLAEFILGVLTPPTDTICRHIAKGLACGVAHLARRRILHRDLHEVHPTCNFHNLLYSLFCLDTAELFSESTCLQGNVLIGNIGCQDAGALVVKICDFGWACLMQLQSSKLQVPMLTGGCVARSVRPPEIWLSAGSCFTGGRWHGSAFAKCLRLALGHIVEL